MRALAAAALLTMALTALGLAQERSPSSGAQPSPEAAVPAAQAPVITGLPRSAPASDRVSGALVSEQLEGDLLASDLMGRDLYDPAGRKIGEVTDVLLDRNRTLKAAIATLDPSLGLRGKRIGIPFSALHWSPASSREVRVVATIDPAELKEAKGFEPLAREAGLDDNQDLTTGTGAATGGSVPPTR